MSGTRIEELNDQAGTFIDLAFNGEVSGGELKAVSAGYSYTDAEVHSFLSSINQHRVQGKPAGIIIANSQSSLIEKIKQQLDKQEFQSLKTVLKIFPLTVDKTATTKEHINKAEIDKINYFLDESNQNVMFALQMASLREEGVVYRELQRLKRMYPSKQVIAESPRLVEPPKPTNLPTQTGSSTAHVLAGTQSASPSMVIPSATSKKVNFLKVLSNINKSMNIENTEYVLKFDEHTQASSVKIEVYKKDQNEALGSFTVTQDKITAHKMTAEIAFAMMKAYMEANPGEHMEIKPKDKAAHGFFVEAAKRFKKNLDKINYTINAVDGLEKIDVRMGKEQASKIRVPAQAPVSDPVPAVATSPSVPTSEPKLEKPVSVPVKQAVTEPLKVADVPAEPSKVVEVPPKPAPVDSPSNDYHPQSLADGNCLFNSFALGLLQIQQSGIKISPTLQAFIDENKGTFSLDHASFQKQLAIKLRELSCRLSYMHRDINSHQLEEPLWEAYCQYQSQQPSDDDIFSPHALIIEKFKEKDLTREQLTAWWLDTGYSEFLVGMQENGCWAGDLELKELATHFEINLNIIDLNTTSENNKPVLHLYAMQLNNSELEPEFKLNFREKSMLIDLGVIRMGGSDTSTYLALNAEQLRETVDTLDKMMELIPRKSLLPEDIKKFMPQFIKLGLITVKNGKVSGEIGDVSERLRACWKVHCQLGELNEQVKDKPIISLQHAGKHWDVMHEVPKPKLTPRR